MSAIFRTCFGGVSYPSAVGVFYNPTRQDSGSLVMFLGSSRVSGLSTSEPLAQMIQPGFYNVIEAFPPPINLMIDKKESATRNLVVSARNGHTKIEDFYWVYCQLLTGKRQIRNLNFVASKTDSPPTPNLIWLCYNFWNNRTFSSSTHKRQGGWNTQITWLAFFLDNVSDFFPFHWTHWHRFILSSTQTTFVKTLQHGNWSLAILLPKSSCQWAWSLCTKSSCRFFCGHCDGSNGLLFL